METRASYLLVGLFVLGLLAAAAGFVAWLARYGLDEQRAYYYIYFRGSVTGLAEGSAVRMRGVPVGTVQQIEIDANNIELIEVTITVKPSTPVKTNTVASLQLQGITGLSFVQLSGGTQNAPRLEPRPGKRRGVIPSTPSPFEKLFESAPELMSNVTLVAERVATMMSEENIAHVGQILANIDVATAAVAAESDDIRALIADLRRTAAEAATTATAAQQLIQEGQRAMGRVERELAATLGDARTTLRDSDRLVNAAQPLIGDLRTTAQSFTRMADDFDLLARDVRPPIRDFADSGIYELISFLAEARALAATLQRVATQLERDPARFLFGDANKGFQPAK